jgi:hypothetical protein
MLGSRLQLLRSYIFGGGIVMIAVLFIITDQLVRKMDQEAQSVSLLFAEFAANTASSSGGDQDPRVQEVYRDVITRINFPLVLTDRQGRPRVWRHVGVDLDEVTEHEIQTLDPQNPVPESRLAAILTKVEELDAENRPIPIRLPGQREEFGHVHFGKSPLASQLRYFPLLEFAMVAVFGLLALLGYRSIKDSEQRSVWVGMARETAHQLGTPISSLMGWLEVVRDRIQTDQATGQATDQVVLDRAFLNEVLDEIENDTARLDKIASRFSNVGSVPNLDEQDVVPVVAEATHYLMRRLPHVRSKVRLVEKYEEVPPVNINRELMEWVVENLLKNALDALERGRDGEITVEVRREPNTETVDIRIRDNGRGMTQSEQRRIFEPGYSTKQRGWGLGLSLSRRIVEEYHGGRLFLEASEPGQGSTFCVQFPV